MSSRMSPLPKFALLSAILFAITSLIYSISTIGDRDSANARPKSSTNNATEHRPPIQFKSSITDAFQELYDTIRVPVRATSYSDAAGNTFETKVDAPWWTERLRERILILDIDTRVPDASNELWGKGKMDWETLRIDEDWGMMSASQTNHFLYAQIHGYEYKYLQARELPGLHNTWVKPHVLLDFLSTGAYNFVVFIDADATIQHLEVPLEWTFNRWGITAQTSIAMPLDVRMGLPEDYTPEDPGRYELNTGVIITQNLAHTLEMLRAWRDCPTETRYPGCGRWKQKWAHEQRAFSEYILADFNPNGTNIVEIPCDDAMGFPGITETGWIADRCEGQFIRHHTIDKEAVKRSVEVAMMQSLTDIAQKELRRNERHYWIKEAERAGVEDGDMGKKLGGDNEEEVPHERQQASSYEHEGAEAYVEYN